MQKRGTLIQDLTKILEKENIWLMVVLTDVIMMKKDQIISIERLLVRHLENQYYI